MTIPKYAFVENLAHWQQMHEQAIAGVIEIPEDTAKKCDAACVEYLNALDRMLSMTGNLSKPEAFGTLESAQALAAKFHRLSIGPDRSARSAIQYQIEIVKTMQEMFQQYFKSIDDVDQNTAAAIGNQLPPK